MRLIDQAVDELTDGAKEEPKKIVVIFKTTPRHLAAALLALGAAPGHLALEACRPDPVVPL